MDFSRFDLSNVVAERLTKIGIRTFTPIQEKFFERIHDSKDLLLTSLAGEGKVTAAMIAALELLLERQKDDWNFSRKTPRVLRGPKVIFFASSRQQAEKLKKDFDALAGDLGFTAHLLYDAWKAARSKKLPYLEPDVVIGSPAVVYNNYQKVKRTLEDVPLVIFCSIEKILQNGMGDQCRDFCKLVRTERKIFLANESYVSLRKFAESLSGDLEAIQAEPQGPSSVVSERFIIASAYRRRQLIPFMFQEPWLDFRRTLVVTTQAKNLGKLKNQLESSGIKAELQYPKGAAYYEPVSESRFQQDGPSVFVTMPNAVELFKNCGIDSIVFCEFPPTTRDYLNALKTIDVVPTKAEPRFGRIFCYVQPGEIGRILRAGDIINRSWRFANPFGMSVPISQDLIETNASRMAEEAVCEQAALLLAERYAAMAETDRNENERPLGDEILSAERAFSTNENDAEKAPEPIKEMVAPAASLAGKPQKESEFEANEDLEEAQSASDKEENEYEPDYDWSADEEDFADEALVRTQPAEIQDGQSVFDECESQASSPRKTLTIRSGYVPKPHIDNEITISEPLSSNTVELRAAQARERRAMRGSNEPLTHQTVGKNGRRFVKNKTIAAPRLPNYANDEESILGFMSQKPRQAKHVGRKQASMRKSGEELRPNKRPSKGDMPYGVETDRIAQEKILPKPKKGKQQHAQKRPSKAVKHVGPRQRPVQQVISKAAMASSDFSPDALDQLSETMTGAIGSPVGTVSSQKPQKKKGTTVRTPRMQRLKHLRKQRENVTEKSSEAVAANADASDSVTMPTAERQNAKVAAKPISKAAKPEKAEKSEKKGRLDFEPSRRKNFKRGSVTVDDDNFGNSIHYKPKHSTGRPDYSMPASTWQSPDPFGYRPTTLSLPQTMPAQNTYGFQSVFGAESQPDNRVHRTNAAKGKGKNSNGFRPKKKNFQPRGKSNKS